MWVAIGTGVSVFLFVIAALGGAARQMGRQTDEEWLFSRFFEKSMTPFSHTATHRRWQLNSDHPKISISGIAALYEKNRTGKGRLVCAW